MCDVAIDFRGHSARVLAQLLARMVEKWLYYSSDLPDVTPMQMIVILRVVRVVEVQRKQ